MSYCDDVWVSDFNYLAFYNWDASLDRATRSRGPAPAERVFFVSGGIEAGRVSNLRAFDLPDQFETPDQGDHRLELLDADGNLVAARRFATARTDRFPGSSGFSVKIDRSGLEVEGYRIVGPGEQLLLEERRSGTHPRVEIQSAELTAQRTRRIAWREDGDRELLRVVMVYAEPSGRWEIRSFGGEQTSYEWKELDEETRPLHVRVIVSDGVRSDTADAAF
jgi:hypothetical protein